MRQEENNKRLKLHLRGSVKICSLFHGRGVPIQPGRWGAQEPFSLFSLKRSYIGIGWGSTGFGSARVTILHSWFYKTDTCANCWWGIKGCACERCVKVSLWYHLVGNKQLTTSEENQSLPAIWCKTLFDTYNNCRREIKSFPKRTSFTLKYMSLM